LYQSLWSLFQYAILNIEIITFNSGPTTTTEQQRTTDKTTTKKPNDGSTNYWLIIVIVIALIVIIIFVFVIIKIRGNKPDNSNKTWEPTENKPDTPENMAMQHSNHGIMQ
jgi:heme/copper-type cytochrome/quinol oxidase subunit 2